MNGSCGANLTWRLEGNTLYIEGTGPMSENYWGQFGFPRDGVETVIIAPGCTSIGGGAFRGCSNLTSVSIPDSVTSIFSAAFASCTKLRSISLPDSITKLDGYSFRWCTALTEIKGYQCNWHGSLFFLHESQQGYHF